MIQKLMTSPRSALETLSRRQGDPTWLAQSRREALESYLERPSPDGVQHLWRYSTPSTFAPRDEDLSLAAEQSPGATALHVELSDEARSRGVVVRSLREAMGTHAELVRAHLGTLIGGAIGDDGSGKFEALNLAFWTAGTFVHIPRGVDIQKPIHLRLTVPSSSGAFFASRLLIVAEENSQATIVDELEGGGDGVRVNDVVEVFAAQASRLSFASVQRLDRGVIYHVAQRGSVERDARLLTAIASLGSAATKSDFGTYLRGPGANAELSGFLFGEGKQHFDHHTVHDHLAGKTYSNLDFKVVLKDRARSAYTGLIRIEPDCPGSEAYQENRNLLLNDGPRAESIPELEILTDEVKCTHGATMGTLDAHQVFYLMSRGIDRAEAIRLVVGGFIEPTLSRLDPDLRERLRAHVEERVREL